MTSIQKSYLEKNQVVLDHLKNSNDSRHQSIKRYLKCQDKYLEALSKNNDPDEAAAEYWNRWAIKIQKQRVVTATPRVEGGQLSSDSAQQPDERNVNFSNVTFGNTAELTEGSNPDIS